MRIEVVTLFPGLVREALGHGVLGRAIERGLVVVACEDPRAHASGPHRSVDDRPYGGGPGMVGTPGPWSAAIDAASARLAAATGVSVGGAGGGLRRVYLSAQGVRFDQAMARRLAATAGLVLVAGRYEGLDERVLESRIDLELSLGDFVLSGGEFAALAVIDAVARLQPGALGDERSGEEESFSVDGLLDWPHYTRPVEWEGRSVPEVLQGGHHAQILRWRRKQALGRTWLRRPDLIAALDERGGLDTESRTLLNEYLAEREVEKNG
ncbi:MAG: tRNA (guanosine(37)-N1)-methyltransferase TrmD [Steroidobacteraceae bacterium]